MRSKAGKGLILSISSLLYWILRALDIISKPIYVLDIFMLIILLYSIYLIKFKSIDQIGFATLVLSLRVCKLFKITAFIIPINFRKNTY